MFSSTWDNKLTEIKKNLWKQEKKCEIDNSVNELYFKYKYFKDPCKSKKFLKCILSDLCEIFWIIIYKVQMFSNIYLRIPRIIPMIKTNPQEKIHLL